MHADRAETDQSAAHLLGVARRIDLLIGDHDLRGHAGSNWRLGSADVEATALEHR